MQGRNGFSNTSKDFLVFDSGEAYVNIDLDALEDGSASDPVADAIGASGARSLGAFNGGASFNPNRTLRDIPADGKRGGVKGLRRRESINPQLTVNLMEITVENLFEAIAGATSETAGSFEKITGGPITDDNYVDNIALITTLANQSNPILFVLLNGLVVEAPTMQLTDGEEMSMELTFTGHFAGADMDAEPWFIYHPSQLAT